MNRATAQEVLLFYRPAIIEPLSAEMAEAIELTRHDAGLNEWFIAHCAAQRSISERLRRLEPPENAARKVLRRCQRRRFPLRPGAWAAAAALVLLGALVFFRQTAGRQDDLNGFRARMVRTVLREYRMDVVTNELAAVQSYLASAGGPVVAALPMPLSDLKVIGGGLLRWKDHPVSMVCFDRGDRQMLFLFVIEQQVARFKSTGKPQAENRLMTRTWTEGGRTYLLAGPPDTPLLQSGGPL